MKKAKKIFSVLICVIMVLCVFPITCGITTNAAYSGYYTYTVSNGKATITDCNTSISGNVVIPSTLGGYSVTSIGDYAFAACKDISGITLPNSVTSIGDDAFVNCSNMKSITIPEGVPRIGNDAFAGCSSLINITIPNSVTIIDDYAFSSCSSLTNIIIPNRVEYVGKYTFSHCSSLERVTIGDSVTSIGECAFRYCGNLTSVRIGNSVASIGGNAFYECNSIKSITLPHSVTSIGMSAFYCTDLKNVYYYGTYTDWNNIDIKIYGSAYLTKATRHYIFGDLDGNDVVNASDIIIMKKELFEFFDINYVVTEGERKYFDINNDSRFDILDLVLLKQKALEV